MNTDKDLKHKKMVKFTQFCNFQRALGKISLLKIPAQTFETGDFLNIFGIFEAHFLIKIFLIRKRVSETNKSTV